MEMIIDHRDDEGKEKEKAKGDDLQDSDDKGRDDDEHLQDLKQKNENLQKGKDNDLLNENEKEGNDF